MERQKPRSRKKKPLGIRFWAAVGGGTVAVAAVIAAVIYIQAGKKYQTVFFPNTVINGIDASQKSIEEVKRLIASGIDGYVLTIKERGGETESVKGTDIGLESVFDGSLEQLLNSQNPNDWIRHRNTPQTFEIGTMIQYDEAKFNQVTGNLKCFNDESIIKPENAYVSDYESGKGYRVVPAVEGRNPDREKVISAISEAVTNLKQVISLEEADVYQKPSIPGDDPVLVKRVEDLNKLANVRVTYTFGSSSEVLSGETISKWIGVGEDGNVYLNSGSVTEYVKELASKYDTYNKAKYLNTSYGSKVRITGGSYGWRINQSEEADELAAIIRSGESQNREPVYKQKAASHGENDYGNTYVEINLTAQHLFYYKDGSLVAESDFVSGNQSKGWATPAGVYPLTYKERNAVLKGENYKTPVDYWMPFNGGIGMHDATWRSSFGGTLYKSGGSHGCINLPHSVAQKIFENIASGTPVLCYHLDGTESKTTSNAAGTPKPTTAPETTPAATTPPQPTTAPAPETTSAPESTATPTPETSPEQTSTPETTKAPSTNGEKGPGVSSESSEQKEIGPGV